MENIISKLRAKNISIDVLNNQLKLKIPEGLECTELLDEVRKNKAELITFIEGLKNVNKFDSIPVAAQQKYYALSSAQKRLYFLHEFDRESLAYNMPQAAWVSGKLDSERLVNAFQMLMMRHEILRTTIEMVGDEPFQVIGDGSGFSITEYQSGAEAVAGVMESFIRPFDLKRGPLLRVGLLHVTDGTSLLMVDMHHIITDGVSHGILIRDFMSLYDAQQLPVLRLQYKDYAEWQQSGAEQTRMREQKSFWLTEYRDIPEALELPLDRQRSEQSSNKSGNYSFELNEETTAALRRLAEEQGTTLYIVLLSVYTILLSKLSNQEDIVVGTPVAGRRHADLEDMIGVFINMLAIRNFPEGRLGFQDFLRKVSSRTLSCFDHQDFQYEELVDELKLPRGTGRNPLFEATFSYENFNTEALSIPGLQFSPYAQGSGISKFDLSLFASEYAGRLQLGFSYAADLFSEVKIKCFGSYLERIVNAIILRPDILIEEIDILSEEEKYQLLNQHNRSLDAYPEEYTIISCFEKQVMLHPERVAIVDQGSELTYRSLDAMSNRLARVLQKEGVGPNSIVGLLTGRSQETIIGMLGILKAGGAYLPMDLDYPQDRINYLLEDSKAMLLLVTDADHHEIYTIKTLTVQEVIDEESVSEEAVVPVNKADDLCYVIYTSGTTGYPKGVLVEHRNVVRLFFHSSPLFDFNEADVWTMFHNPYFDFSVWEMYGALLFGGKLVIIPKMVAIDSENFLSLLVSHGVTVLNQTPSAFYNLIEAESLAGLSLDQLKLRYIIFGGESLKPLKLAGWFKKYPNTQLINMFGITETTVHVTYKLIDEQEIMGNVNNIGVPIPTLSTYIFDACQRLVPQGVSGELYVGGAGVSRGYLNRAELNELRFVQNPYRPGERLYRTGDLCRQQINGELEYIGRIDHQVNIRGYRIEPGEIENRLQEYENISDAVVMAKGEEGDKYLVAYYVAEKPISIAVIREYLQELLPDYMLPSYYVHLSSFLLTVNGKIDRRGLPEVDLSAEDHYVAARGAMEELLVSIWSDVLKLSPDRISVTRSFFDLGGHSLKAMNLVNRIRKETGSEVALKTIFSHQDIRSLSLHMSGLSGGPAYSAILPAVDKPHYVLSSAQKRLYFLYEFDRSSLAYNMPQAVWLKGEVDRARLLRSFEQLVGRHEILRTSFVLLGDEPFQVIGDGSGFTVTEYDADEEGVSVVMSGFVRPFDLSRGPLIRVGLVNVSPGLTLLMVDMHHIISDGVSHGILIGDFMSFYSGEDPGPVGLQYKDYAEWQQGAAEQERMLGQKSFWLSEYGELPLALELPLDYPRTKGASHPGGSYGLELDEATTSSLRRLGEEEGATLFMVLLSVYTVFLGRLCNSDDVVVGTPVAGRGHADLDGVMGVFINMLALRNRPRGDLSFRAFLKEVRSHALSCFEHQDFQYEDLVDELNLPRDTGRTPLFDATFSYQNFDGSSLSIPGLELLPYGQGSGISKFDLSLFASEDSGGLQLSLVYSTGLFSASTVRGFGTYLEQLFRSVAAGPGLSLGELNLLPAGERSALLELGKGAGFVYGREKTVVDLFCEQARQHADSVAVVYEGGVLRYGELDGLSNQLASLLRDTYGIRPGDTVGISVGGSELLLVGILGILKAGGVYVPFDVDYPADRKSYLCSDAGIRLLLSVTDHVFDAVDYYGGAIMALDAELDCDALGYSRPVVPLTGNSLAYISYTSGSTGSPKGVMVPHQGILRLLHLSDIELGEPTVTLQLSPVSFDAATFEIWAALLSGGKVVMKGDGLIDLSGLHGLIESHGVNTLWLTSGLLDQWCEGDLSGLPLRYVLSGGDVVRAASVAKVYRQLPGVCVYNGYGPTENTTFTCMYAIPRGIADQSHIPIGRPVMGTDVYVLGRSGGLSPLGVSGELCVSGFGLAQGYVGNDALTREKFVANPFEENSLMYRTGDLVRWGDDGNLEFLGRMDSQVKIRGYRIEPGEIEVVMGGLDGINQVLVEVVGDGPEKALVAYYTTLSGLAVEDLKERVKELLPDYMLPSYYVHLASFPLTLNGKIDRRKLPVVELSGESDYHAPSGEMEELLVSVWSEVLKLAPEGISVTRSFFDLGGHSLKAMSLANRIWKEVGVEVSLKAIFSHQDIRSLSAYVSSLSGGSGYSAIAPAIKKTHYALSSAQKRLYFLYEFDRSSLAYNMPRAVWLRGEVDRVRLCRSFEQLIGRHEILRTGIELLGDEPFQVVGDGSGFSVTEYDADEEGVSAVMSDFIRPFDLSRGPLIRVGLVSVSPLQTLLMVDMHHIITDGVSHGILIRDFMTFYGGGELSSPGLQYKDYAEWQQGAAEQERMEGQKSFWLSEYGEVPGVLDLPVDYVRPDHRNHRGGVYGFVLGEQVTGLLRGLAEDYGCTLYVVLLSVYNILLGRLCRREDVVVGTPVAGRRHADLEGMIGMFVNTLALRNYPRSGLSFGAFVKEVGSRTLSCFDHQDFQYEDLIDELKLPRDLGRNPLIEVMFSYENFEQEALEIPGLVMSAYEQDGERRSKFDLSLSAGEYSGGLQLSFSYSAELFSGETVSRFAAYFKHIVDQVVSDPGVLLGDISLLDAGERSGLLELGKGPVVDYGVDRTVLSLFAEQVLRDPSALAIVFEDQVLSYRELDGLSNQMALFLINNDVTSGTVIGLMIDRSPELIVGILGILKAGGTYLPIDSALPEERVLYMLDDSGAEFLLTSSTYLEKYLNHISVLNIAEVKSDNRTSEIGLMTAEVNDLLYIIYTSGSTGKPKGVMVSNGSLVNFIQSQKNLFKIDSSDRILQFSTISFDASVEQIWLALLSGAGLVLVAKDVITDQKMFNDYLRVHKVTHLHTTPSFLESISLSEANSLKRIITGGEVCKPELVNRYVKKYDFYNKYGPTEATISCTIFHVDDTIGYGSMVPIGRPIAGSRVYVVDGYGGLSPMGVAGELCVSGLGLAQGYVGNEKLTAEKFVVNPFEENSLMYRTGDLVRWGPGGNLEFLGRVDDQVKIRGYRIEPGEIEVVMGGLEGVGQVLVVARGDGGEKALVAYYTTQSGEAIPDLKERAQELLPDYMLPSYYVHLSSFLLTVNGKIDRRGLPEVDLSAEDHYVAARGAMEELLVSIWSDVLKLSPDRISVTRSFFDLGGHSLKAMNLVNRIRKETGSEVALKTIFSHQDIRSLSLHMSGLSGGPAYSAILPAVDKPHYVLSSAQKRLYFLYEFDRSSLAYNMPQAVWLKGEVDRARLLRSFEQLVGRHEILRTSFVLLGDEPFQVIGDGSGFTVTEYDADEEGVSVVMSGFVRPFDLSRGPLIRVGLVNVSPGLTLLMVDMHHIISDGVSHGILIGDFMSFYSGEDPGPVGLQYKDYAEWQQGAAEQERMLGQKSFWLSEYGELPLALELPLDYPRTKGASHPGGSYGLELDEATTSSLRRLGEEEGATLFMVLLSVYTVFLGRLCNSDDVVVGTPVAGRGHADLDGVMGVFINMLALRNRPRGDLSFRAFLKEVRSHALSCFEHQDFQYEDLVDELNLPRDTGRTPLFDATFSYQNFDGSSLSIPGLELLPYGQGSGISKFDLSLFASEDSGGLQLSLVYSTGLFSASTVRGFGTYLEQLFRSVAAGPGLSLGELNLLPAGERSALLELGKGAGFVYGREKTVVDLFCEQARQHADSVAVVYEGGVLRYGELDGLSNQLASLLRDTYGIRPGDTVGISVGGSELLLVGILGILKAGGVYVPFDVDYPADRKSYLCSDAGIRLLLSVTDHVFDAVDYYGGAIMALDAELDCDALGYSRPVVPLTGNSLAYISYTSGSTGSPKGVMVPHQGILRLLHLSDIELGEPTVTLQLSPVSFDAATFEIWAALLSGGKVVMKGDGLIDLSGLHGLIESHGVNTLWLTSGLLDQWCEGDLSGLPLRYVLSGGDVVRAASVAKVYRQLPGVCVYNGYGPTENTTFTCMYAIPRGIADQSHIPIGRPVMGTDVYVLGRSGGLSPLGVSGELCVSGFGLAQGYVGNDALTREKFVANPFEENSLMYRTGDLVRWGDDGNLEFLGRMDSQVKIRGYRIEPGEIEVVMGGLDGINQVLVEVVGDGPEKALVAYYTTLSGLAVEDLKERVKELLPDYMLPSYYVHLASFPLTLNGKIDRRKLPVVELSGESDYHAPSGEMEELLVSVWSEVLKLAPEGISVTRSFFDLGGHSLKAMSLANKIHRTFAVDFPISEVFNNPTIKSMAKIIEVQQWIGEGVNEGSEETIKIKI